MVSIATRKRRGNCCWGLTCGGQLTWASWWAVGLFPVCEHFPPLTRRYRVQYKIPAHRSSIHDRSCTLYPVAVHSHRIPASDTSLHLHVTYQLRRSLVFAGMFPRCTHRCNDLTGQGHAQLSRNAVSGFAGGHCGVYDDTT